jgi:hypothetical protein
MTDTKLSDILQSMDECGDSGRALEGLPELAKSLEDTVEHYKNCLVTLEETVAIQNKTIEVQQATNLRLLNLNSSTKH